VCVPGGNDNRNPPVSSVSADVDWRSTCTSTRASGCPVRASTMRPEMAAVCAIAAADHP